MVTEEWVVNDHTAMHTSTVSATTIQATVVPKVTQWTVTNQLFQEQLRGMLILLTLVTNICILNDISQVLIRK